MTIFMSQPQAKRVKVPLRRRDEAPSGPYRPKKQFFDSSLFPPVNVEEIGTVEEALGVEGASGPHASQWCTQDKTTLELQIKQSARECKSVLLELFAFLLFSLFFGLSPKTHIRLWRTL